MLPRPPIERSASSLAWLLPMVHRFPPLPPVDDALLYHAAADAGAGVRRHTACSRRSSAELPAWKKTAEEVETPNELCVGDVVRARYVREAAGGFVVAGRGSLDGGGIAGIKRGAQLAGGDRRDHRTRKNPTMLSKRQQL